MGYNSIFKWSTISIFYTSNQYVFTVNIKAGPLLFLLSVRNYIPIKIGVGSFASQRYMTVGNSNFAGAEHP